MPSTVTASGQDAYRARRHALDGCLSTLEDAHERDELVVSTQLVGRLRGLVPAIVPGMLVFDAIELVFEEHDRLKQQMLASAPAPARPALAPSIDAGEVDLGRPLAAQGARRLTEQIRSATRLVCLLLLEAYERRAWFALGYRCWEDYVRSELGFRRSRAYQLLDQGRVIRALQAAANTAEMPDISSYAAEQIKPHLDDAVAMVSRAVTPGESPVDVIAQVVSRIRQQHVAADPEERGNLLQEHSGDEKEEKEKEEDQGIARDARLARSWTPEGGGRRRGSPHLGQLFDAIDCLAALPSVEVLAEEEYVQPAELDRALRWLTEFEEACQRRAQGTDHVTVLEGVGSPAS